MVDLFFGCAVLPSFTAGAITSSVTSTCALSCRWNVCTYKESVLCACTSLLRYITPKKCCCCPHRPQGTAPLSVAPNPPRSSVADTRLTRRRRSNTARAWVGWVRGRCAWGAGWAGSRARPARWPPSRAAPPTRAAAWWSRAGCDRRSSCCLSSTTGLGCGRAAGCRRWWRRSTAACSRPAPARS